MAIQNHSMEVAWHLFNCRCRHSQQVSCGLSCVSCPLRSAVESHQGRYGLASECCSAGITRHRWHCRGCPCLLIAAVVSSHQRITQPTLDTGRDGSFVPVPISMPGLPGRSEGWGRRREVVKTAPQLLSLAISSPLSFSTPPLLPQARGRSKEANMKGIPEILSVVALSPCSPAYRYGNAQPVPRLTLSLFPLPPLFLLSSHLPLSPSSLLAPIQQPSGFQVDSS